MTMPWQPHPMTPAERAWYDAYDTFIDGQDWATPFAPVAGAQRDHPPETVRAARYATFVAFGVFMAGEDHGVS